MQSQSNIAVRRDEIVSTRHLDVRYFGESPPTLVPAPRSLSARSLETADCAPSLTDRECTILQLLSLGLSNKEAASFLKISPETVKSHVKNIFDKLRVDRRAQAVSRGLGLGFIKAA